MSPIDLTRRHYEALGDRARVEGHPVDRLIYALPEIQRIDRMVRRLADRMTRGRQDDRRGREHLDLRLRQMSLHEERFFDVGYELGRLAGFSDASAASTAPELQDLTRILGEAIVLSAVRHDLAAAALLALTQGLVLQPRHLPRGGS